MLNNIKLVVDHSTLLTDNFNAKKAKILKPIDMPINIPMHFHIPRTNPIYINYFEFYFLILLFQVKKIK